MNLFLHLFQFLIKYKQNVEMPEKEIVYQQLQSYSPEIRPVSFSMLAKKCRSPENEKIDPDEKIEVAGFINQTVDDEKRL